MAGKFINPFDKGVTYDAFLKACKDKSPSEYLKGKCTDEQIDWIKTELIEFKKNNK